MKCTICSRDSGEKSYCGLHMKAHESKLKKYNGWKNALEISWKEYLSEIAKNPLTGEWVKEVAKHLIQSGEIHSVTEN